MNNIHGSSSIKFYGDNGFPWTNGTAAAPRAYCNVIFTWPSQCFYEQIPGAGYIVFLSLGDIVVFKYCLEI